MTALPMSILEDVLKKILKQLMDRCHILQAILYGSYARGDARGKSDVDLLLVVENNPGECESYAMEIASDIGLSILQPVALTLEEIVRDREKQVLYHNALLEGLIIYHSLKAPLTKTAPKDYELCTLIRYKAPKKVLKKLVGTTVSRRRGRSRARGLIEKMGGLRIAPGLVLIPTKNVEALEHIFQQLNTEYKIMGYILASIKQLEPITKSR